LFFTTYFKKDIKTKSNGQRPTQRYLAKGCPVNYKLTLSKQGRTKGLYVVKSWETKHNHLCGEEDFKLNAKNRKLSEDQIQEAILMLKNKVKVIQLYLITFQLYLNMLIFLSSRHMSLCIFYQSITNSYCQKTYQI
jgi:hypothetical protein